MSSAMGRHVAAVVLAAAFALVTACGSTDDAASPPASNASNDAAIVGTWMAVSSGGGIDSWTFSADGKYARTAFLGASAEAISGTYTAAAGTLHVHAAKTTCASVLGANATIRYSVNGDDLSTIIGSSFDTYHRGTPSIPEHLTFGCFDGGVFTPMPLQQE